MLNISLGTTLPEFDCVENTGIYLLFSVLFLNIENADPDIT
jgi:hypothetical protein